MVALSEENLGANKVNNNGTVSIPREVLDLLDLEKGEGFVGFKNCDQDGYVKITQIEVDF